MCPYFDAALIGVGAAGLAFHCYAMFFRRTAEHLPGVHSAIRSINAMGTSSRVWFIVPALLVVIGLRRQNPVVVLVVAATLVAVGVTMYDHGPLRTHLNRDLRRGRRTRGRCLGVRGAAVETRQSGRTRGLAQPVLAAIRGGR